MERIRNARSRSIEGTLSLLGKQFAATGFNQFLLKNATPKTKERAGLPTQSSHPRGIVESWHYGTLVSWQARRQGWQLFVEFVKRGTRNATGAACTAAALWPACRPFAILTNVTLLCLFVSLYFTTRRRHCGLIMCKVKVIWYTQTDALIHTQKLPISRI